MRTDTGRAMLTEIFGLYRGVSSTSTPDAGVQASQWHLRALKSVSIYTLLCLAIWSIHTMDYTTEHILEIQVIHKLQP